MISVKNMGLLTICMLAGGLTFTATITTGAQARPYPDEVGICYLFDDDEIQTINVCVIQSGYGTGEQYTTLRWDKSIYDILSDGQKYSLNDKDAKLYLRDAAFYRPLSDAEVLSKEDEPVLFCYKTSSIDICHN